MGSSFDERLERELAKIEEEKKKKKKQAQKSQELLGRYSYLPSSVSTTPKTSDDIAPVRTVSKKDDDIIKKGQDMVERYHYTPAPIKTTTTTKTTNTKNTNTKTTDDKVGSYLSVSGKEDFKEKSSYISTEADSFWDRFTSKYGLGYNDLQYEYINNKSGLRDEIDAKAVSWGSDTGKTTSSYAEKALDYMTNDEVAVYNYYYQTEGKEKAQEFLDALAETLSARKAGKSFENMQGKIAAEILYGIPAGAEQFKQGVKNLGNMIAGKDDYLPQTSTQILTGMVREDLADDGVEVLGSSVAQMAFDALSTGTNMIPSIAVGAINPAAGAILMGGSAAGNTYQEALNEGLDKNGAKLYAATIGTLEGTLQYVLGGIGKLGGTSATINRAVSGIKNGALRFAAEYAGKIASEGIEEGLQEILDPIVKNMILGTDEEVDWESVGYSALLGGLMGGVFGASEVKTDHLSNNEQAVIDKVYKDRIAEAEADGTKLTNSKKNKLFDSIVEDMEKGRISTDTIEEVLGDRSSYDALTKEAEEFKTLYETESGKLSEKQRDRLAELKEKNSKKSYEEALNEAKQKNLDEVYELVKGDRLSESFNEKARKSQKYEADLNQYNEKQRKVVQKAIDSGILNNTNRTHELVDLIANIASQKDLDFDFTNNARLKESGFALDGKTVNGYVTDNGVTLNIESAKVLNAVVGHEVTHVLEGTDLYNALSDAVMNYAISKEGVDGFNKRVAELESLYKGDKNTTPEKELVADLVGDYLFTDSEFVSRLSTENRNIFEKIYDEIKYLCRVATSGSKEARELEKVKKAFEDAYRADGKAQGDTKYYISKTTDGRSVAVVNNDILSSIDTSQWDKETKKSAQKAANEALKAFSDGFDINGIEYVGNKKNRDEYTRSDYSEALANNNTEAYLDKMRAASVLDDVVRVATEWKNDGYLKYDRPDYVDFIRGKALIKSGDRTYRAIVLAGIKENGKAFFHDVVDIYPDSFEIKDSELSTAVATNESPNAILESSDGDNLAQVEDIVNKKFSFSDSSGRQLSGEQVDGIAVASNVAEIMKSPEYSKPKDYMVKYSVSTTPEWTKSYLEKNNTEEGRAVVNAIQSFTDKMVQDDAVRGYVPMGEYKSTKFGPLRTNQEYIWTFDMDTSCPRTFQFLNFRDAIQRKAGRYLTYNESINLLELMRAYGQQIPCCYCYVENKRVLLSASYNNFFGFRNDVMNAATDEEAAKVMYGYSEKKGLPDASRKALERWRSDLSYNPSLTEVWTATNTARNSVLNFLDGEMAAGNIDAKTAETKLNRMVLEEFGVEDKSAILEIEGFVKDWAYDTLANIPHIYNIDNNTDVSVVDERALALNREALAYSKSASSAKSVENYLPYTDQLKNVSEEDRKYIMGMGGIRKHSSNDFRMDYVQDYFLFYADLAAGKWTGHTYTKSADFTKIFACTGDRINMSIAFYEDADGTLRQNTDEGAFWKDVKELRKAYKNVGSMAMVTSDNQLSYALNSDWIDMIIPFHASGLDKSVWYNLRMWNDYTSKQGERFYNADTMKQKLKEAGVVIPKGAKAGDIKTLFEDTFQIKHIYGTKGEVLKPHFFPGDTYVNGQLVPGHHNDVATYFKLCEEYGVHPRFYGIEVTDTNGNKIDVTEHPSYLKLIKETSRTDSEQEAIQFNFGNYDDYLKMTPFEYAMQRLQEEANNGGFENTKEDPYGVVKEFTEEYLDKNRPLGYLTERAKETRDILLEMSREAAKEQNDILAEAQKSLSRDGETPKQYGDWNIRGEDVALEEVNTKSEDDIAPMQETVSKTESVAPYEDNWKDSFDSLTDDDAPPVRGKMVAPDSQQTTAPEQTTEEKLTRKQLHQNIVGKVKNHFKARGFDFDKVLRSAKNLSTFATVDNTPQRVMEKALGYKEGGILADLTVNEVAQNETAGTRWLNHYTDRKNGILAQISKQYHIKPGSKESAAAQMYAEGFYVDENNDIIQYGDRELAMDFPNAKVQQNIKALARDPRIRQIYDQTLKAINASRTRNAYPEIPRLDNYFLHFRAMEDTFSRLGLPFNPNDIRAKDLPTDLNGVTADLKPGQPYFASAMHRTGKRTSFDLLGGLERYLTSAKNQIFHIDDIQNLRALRNYIADTYGQANGLDGLDALSEEEAQERIEKVYDSHLSTFAKFLNEEANILAGKTALIDRGLEGIIGRRGITFLDTVNKQVGSNMVGFNISSSLTNFLPVAQTFAKTNKFDFLKAFAQTAANKVGSIFGKTDGFTENSPVVIRRKGADRFYRTAWQKAADPGYALMGLVDDISTELIARTKYNELTRKGMDSRKAHIETDKWVSRLMGDRSLGQQPQLYNSRMLGLFTKFQLEVRNQLDSQFYDTIQETKASNEQIQNGLLRNAKTAAKVTSTFVQLAVVQHLFGKAFESVAGYNPAFDIIEVIVKAFGWDDDEEDEDTVLDNIEEAFLALLEDLPYTSTLTGGRIPIESALPVEQFVTGKDQYGNEKSRWETLGEVAPYYLLPGGYGQFKKTKAGLDMFSDEHPVAGSYTDSGNLRFPVEDTTLNRAQAAIFGQYASENARYYFDNELAPLKEKQIQEYVDTGMEIQDYWDYREGLKGLDNLSDQADYINSLDIPVETKNILINNLTERKEPINMEGYGNFGSFEEFDFATKNPEKYKIAEYVGGYENYMKYQEDMKGMKLAEKVDYVAGLNLSTPQKNVLINDETDRKEPIDLTGYENFNNFEEFEFAKNNPENYAVAKAVGGYESYKQYSSDLSDIHADKDENGDSISGSRKQKVADYINSLDADYYEKVILFKSQYTSYDDENYEIVEYLNNRDDISYEEMVAILTKLDFTVSPDGRVTWD